MAHTSEWLVFPPTIIFWLNHWIFRYFNTYGERKVHSHDRSQAFSEGMPSNFYQTRFSSRKTQRYFVKTHKDIYEKKKLFMSFGKRDRQLRTTTRTLWGFAGRKLEGPKPIWNLTWPLPEKTKKIKKPSINTSATWISILSWMGGRGAGKHSHSGWRKHWGT